MIVHKDNADQVGATLGFPCVLKQPDSAFSVGVLKAADQAELEQRLAECFEDSDLLVAQEYTPSGFDWRVGVLDREVLYVCKYHVAPGHWQIRRKTRTDRNIYGRVESLPIDEAPPAVVEIGQRAANLIGDGLYGVDLKQIEDRVLVVEINDNPNIEAGCEDKILKDELYMKIMRSFRRRLDRSDEEAQGA
jgi:glutathione synthase/RimK-type ligase-like ATP-grasp enzyme